MVSPIEISFNLCSKLIKVTIVAGNLKTIGKYCNMMKIYILTFCLTIGLLSCDTLSKLPSYGGITGVTESEASEAMRQALDQGVGRGIGLLNTQDGFFW